MNTTSPILERAAENWSLWVWHASWQSALVGLALLAVVWWGRRWPSPLRYWILMLALIKFACPPILPASVGLFGRLIPGVIEERDDAIRGSVIHASTPTDDEVDGAVAQLDLVAHQPDLPIEDARRSSLSGNGKLWLMTAHLIGVLVLLSWIGAKVIALGRVVRGADPVTDPELCAALARLRREHGYHRAIRLLSSRQIDAPVAFGIWNPIILLPATAQTLDRQDRNTVLMHELAHLRRGDPLANWLQLLICAAWWFHPVVWLVSRSLRTVREHCCDDLLLSSGVATHDSYCDTLLRVAGGRKANPIVVGMGHRLHPLAGRLVRIMDSAMRRSIRLSVRGIALVIVLAVLLLPGLGPMQRNPMKQAVQQLLEERTALAQETKIEEKLVPHAENAPLKRLRLSGSLAIDPDRLARVRTRVNGEIVSIDTVESVAPDGTKTERTLRYGDSVKKRQVLAVLTSRDLGEKKAEFLDALARQKRAALTLDAQREAMRKNAISERTLREMEKNVEVDELAARRAALMLRLLHISDEEIRALREMATSRDPKNPNQDRDLEERLAETQIVSPRDGIILEKNCAVGDIVDAKQDLFKIADLSRIAVFANVAESDLPRLEKVPPSKRRWTITFNANPKLKPVQGTFEAPTKIIDPNQHTALVVGSIDNPDGEIAPGQFITAEIELGDTAD